MIAAAEAAAMAALVVMAAAVAGLAQAQFQGMAVFIQHSPVLLCKTTISLSCMSLKN